MSNDSVKNCPHCNEEIKAKAIKCKYCYSLIDEESTTENTNLIQEEQEKLKFTKEEKQKKATNLEESLNERDSNSKVEGTFPKPTFIPPPPPTTLPIQAESALSSAEGEEHERQRIATNKENMSVGVLTEDEKRVLMQISQDTKWMRKDISSIFSWVTFWGILSLIGLVIWILILLN